MKKPFRETHLLKIFEGFVAHHLPLDLFLSKYFRAHKAVGSKDRKFIAESVYGMMRWRGLLDHLCPKPLTWENRFALFQKINPTSFFDDPSIPLHVRLSFPKSFFQSLLKQYDEPDAIKICQASNTEAPTTIRVNALKSDREPLLKRWEGEYSVSACPISEQGIRFHRRINFFALPEFKEGLFEIQDEGSQLVAGLVKALPGQQVLDYCAGSGGKTLAFAPSMQGTGQIYLHDIRPWILQEAKKRLYRAGIQNAQVLNHDDPKRNRFKGKMDWVLVDAPCTGSGTLRRNPDMKWRFEPEQIDRLQQEQRVIVEEALAFLKPGGKLVYATCSLFHEENERQVEYFQENYGLNLTEPPFKSLPTPGGMDGFFGAVFSLTPSGAAGN